MGERGGVECCRCRAYWQFISGCLWSLLVVPRLLLCRAHLCDCQVEHVCNIGTASKCHQLTQTPISRDFPTLVRPIDLMAKYQAVDRSLTFRVPLMYNVMKSVTMPEDGLQRNLNLCPRASRINHPSSRFEVRVVVFASATPALPLPAFW